MSRAVTLVVIGPDGRLRGTLPTFEVDTPWWPDLEPIRAARPDVVVLRLLRATPAPDHVMGGSAAYLVEMAAGAPAPPDLDPAVDDELAAAARSDHPLRLPWARAGGPSADLAWAASVVDVGGPPVQVKSWNLSSIWRVPVAGGGDVWLKCVPPFFAHEATVLRHLAGRPVPELLASDGLRMLLAPLPGVDGFGASRGEQREIVDVVVGLQAATIGAADELVARGVPDWRPGPFLAAARAVVERRAPEDPHLRALLESWGDRFEAAAACGLPDVLVHGDPHPGNARIGVSPPVIFDWGDSGIGHPLLDVVTTDDDLVRRHWLDAWAAAVPGSDPRRAWDLLRPIAVLRGAVVFQRFLDHIEPSEHPYHASDVDPFLRRAAELVAAGG